MKFSDLKKGVTVNATLYCNLGKETILIKPSTYMTIAPLSN